MNTVVAIINFESLFPGAITEVDSIKLDEKIRHILSHILENNPNVEYVKIRLYGNWYEGISFTKEASALLQKLAEVQLFPMIRPPRNLIRGEILITRQLYGVGHSWDTFFSDLDSSRNCEFVDTMIACNMVSYSMDPDVSSLYLFSNELRHLPAIDIISKLSRKPKLELISSDKGKCVVMKKIFPQDDVTVIYLKL